MNAAELLKQKREEMVEQHNQKIAILQADHESQLASVDQLIDAASKLFGGAVTVASPKAIEVPREGHGKTTDRVQEVLDRSPDMIMEIKNIMFILKDLTYHAIGLALGRLHDNGKVQKVGRGQWQSNNWHRARPRATDASHRTANGPAADHGDPTACCRPVPRNKGLHAAPVAIAAAKAPDDWADTSGPVGQGNETVTPGSKAAVVIGNTLVEPFSATDLKARLDGDGHARSYHFVAEWKRRSWIETCGHLLYKRTARFGEGAA